MDFVRSCDCSECMFSMEPAYSAVALPQVQRTDMSLLRSWKQIYCRVRDYNHAAPPELPDGNRNSPT